MASRSIDATSVVTRKESRVRSKVRIQGKKKGPPEGGPHVRIGPPESGHTHKAGLKTGGYCDCPAPSPSLDAAPSVSPGRPPVDVSVTVRAFMRLDPFFAIEPTTVTSSPIFRVS